MKRPWVQNALLAAGVFALNLVLNAPLFRAGEMPYRDSIEGGYVSMARFFAAHPNPWGWNPMQYCGLPAQFTYLPLLPYRVAAYIEAFPGTEPAQVYRMITTLAACLGPVTLFFFVIYFARSRRAALAIAVAYSVFSPLYGLIPQINFDRGVAALPWRWQLLVKYGEGPHNAGLALLPLALMAMWAAGVGARYWQVLLAAALLAAVALTNWVAALALAFCCLTMLLAAVGTRKITGFRVRRVIAAAALAYLLACFWLTPSFIRIVAFNWPVDAFNYHLREQQTALLAGLAVGLLLLRALFGRSPRRPYLCFVTLTCFGFAYLVLAFYWFGHAAIPEARRYAPEFELFLFLLLFEAARLLRGGTWRIAIAAVTLLLIGVVWRQSTRVLERIGGQAWSYTTEAREKLRPVLKEETIEYRLARRIAERNPAGRVFASGGVRFRLNSWFDLHQVGGGFESGLTNRIPIHFAYQIRSGIGSPPGRDGHDAILQLKALGVEYVVVNGPQSKEHYRDFKNPWKFEGLLETVFSEGDDRIYRIPFRSLAHLVRPEELPEYPPIGGYLRFLHAYVAALDDASRPSLSANWRGGSRLDIEGHVPEGMLVALSVSFYEGWKATQDGKTIPIETNKLGFITLRPDASPAARIELRFDGTREQRVMAGVSALTWVAALAGLFVRRRGSSSGTPQTKSPPG